MNTNELKKLYAIKWNRVTGGFWVGTVEEELATGMSQFRQRANIATLANKTDKGSLEINSELQWTLIGIANTREEGVNFVEQLLKDDAPNNPWATNVA